MTRVIRAVAILVLALTTVAPVAPVDAVVPGAVTWTVDHQAKTITVLAQLQIYSGCSGNPQGSPSAPATCSEGERSQVTQFLADKIKSRIERTWNKPYYYRCYRLIVIVDIKLAPDDDAVDADRIGVMIDPSAANIRSWVEWSNEPSDDAWRSDSPDDAGIPDRIGSTWAEGAQSPRKDVLDDGTVLYTNVETYAHEFGHILGLDDAYHDEKDASGRTHSVPNVGAPRDLMSSGESTLSPETISRLIKRNLPNMHDTQNKPVTDKDLVCGAQFQATLSISQEEYSASNFTFVGCLGAETISRSETQTLIVESQTAVVDAVQLPDGKPAAWGSQTAVLVAAGTPVEAAIQQVPGESFLAPIYFHVPVKLIVNRRNDRPAVGEKPPLEDRGTVPCAGGGGGGPSPTPDCGRRELQADIDVTQLKASELFAAMIHPPESMDSLYVLCSGPEPVPGAFALDPEQWAPAEVKRTRGAFPDAAKLFDPDVPKIEIFGMATVRFEEPGTLVKAEYEWTLTLCRLTDGKPSPDC